MPTRRDADGRWHAEVCVGRRRLHRRLPEGATARDAKRLEAKLRRSLHSQRIERSPSVPGDPLLTDLLANYTEVHATQLRSPEGDVPFAVERARVMAGSSVVMLRGLEFGRSV